MDDKEMMYAIMNDLVHKSDVLDIRTKNSAIWAKRVNSAIKALQRGGARAAILNGVLIATVVLLAVRVTNLENNVEELKKGNPMEGK